MAATDPELLFLHALPLDSSMWQGQMYLLPDATHAPTLYRSGDHMADWANAALRAVKGDRLIVVGCSVGGSCALEVATIAPERIAALILIGTKATLRPDPELHATALRTLEEDGLDAAFETFWAPLFSKKATEPLVERVRAIVRKSTVEDIARGVTVFHTRPNREQIIAGASFPIVFVSGADDTAPGPKRMAMQADLARRGRLHVIPDCGHYVPWEKPEILNRILSETIAEVAGSA